MDFLQLFHLETFCALLFVLTICMLIGNVIIKGNTALGTTTALLSLVAAGDLSYFLCFYLDLSGTVFLCAFVLLSLLLTVSFKALYQDSFRQQKQVASVKKIIEYLFFTAILIFFFLSATLEVTEASAGSHFFQAWNPLYAAYVGKMGVFHLPDGANLTSGFLTSGQYYAPNSLGLVLLASIAGMTDPKNLFYLYNSICILATVLTFSLLLHSLSTRKFHLQQIIFLFLLFVFSALDYNFRLVYVGNFSDEILYLSAALLFYLFVNEGNYRSPDKKYPLIILTSSFFVLGRNYGLYYLGVFCLLYWLPLFRNELESNQNNLSCSIFSLVKKHQLVIVVTIAISLKEVVQIVVHGIHFPRSTIQDIYPYSFDLFKSGLISGLNIGYLRNGISFNIHSIYLVSLGFSLIFCMALKLKSKSTYLISTLKPLIFLLLPLFLEILTQYRKSPDFSKLYIPFMFFSVWYPAYIYKISFTATDWEDSYFRESFLKVTYLAALLVVIYCAAYPSSSFYRLYSIDQYISSSERAIQNRLNGIVQYKRHEEVLFENMKNGFPEQELKGIVKHPVVYFHLEPGLGFRYFAGGNIQNDFDFFSDSVQEILSKSKNVDEFFSRLGYPNLLLYPARDRLFHYSRFTDYKLPVWFESEFRMLIGSQQLTYTPGGYGLQFYSFNSYEVDR